MGLREKVRKSERELPFLYEKSAWQDKNLFWSVSILGNSILFTAEVHVGYRFIFRGKLYIFDGMVATFVLFVNLLTLCWATYMQHIFSSKQSAIWQQIDFNYLDCLSDIVFMRIQ